MTTAPSPPALRRSDSTPVVLSIVLGLLILISLTASLFFKDRWLWMDETLGYTLLSDPSFAHMNRAIVSHMDANPPLFYYVYWPLAHAISLNPFFLKAVSIGLFAATIAWFYRYTTRLLGSPVTNFVLTTIFISLTYLDYTLSTQFRSYSLFLAVSCGYFFVLHRLIRRPGDYGLLAAHALMGLALTMTHNFGLLYVGVSGSFFGLLWLLSRRRAYFVVGLNHVAVGGVWALLWFANFRIQATAGQPHSWIPVPTFVSAFRTVGELIPTLSSRLEGLSVGVLLLRVGLVVGLFAYLAGPRLRRGWRAMVSDDAFSFYVLSGYLLFVTTLLSLLVSLTVVSVFLSRYLWPGHLLILYQLVYAFHALRPLVRWSPRLPGWLPRVALPLYVAGLMAFMFNQNRKVTIFPSGILAYLPQLDARYPVFFESADYFLPIWQHKLANAHFLLNWETAVADGNLPNATTDFKILQSLHDYYGVNAVVPTDQFTKAQFGHFYVVDETSRYQIERFLAQKQVRVVRVIPVAIAGHRIVECTF